MAVEASDGTGVMLRYAGVQLQGLAAGEHSFSGQGQETGPDLGLQAPAGVLGLHMPSCGCTVIPWMCKR